MRDQFDNYEKKIMEELDREAEDIERRIGGDPQAAEARADDGLDRKVYAGVEAYEDAVASGNDAGTVDPACAKEADEGRPAGLSDEDWEAMRLGRELQRRIREEESRKETEGRVRKYAGGWKRIVAAAAVLVLVAGAAGVNGVGGPKRVVEIMKQAVGGREMSQGNSTTDDAKISGVDEETEAYQKIRDELSIEPVKIIRFPGGIKFKSYEVDSEIRLAQLIYFVDNRSLTYLIGDSYTEELWSVKIGDKILDEYPYTEGNLDAIITEYELPESKEKRYVAEFEYKGIYYQLAGTINWEMFEKILKNLHFPS